MAGDPRRVLGGDHLRWFNVMVAKEKISKEGDPRPVPLDDRGPPSLREVLTGSKVRQARSFQGGKGVEQPNRPVVHQVIVCQADCSDAGGDQGRHQLGSSAEVEVLWDLLAATGEWALEV